MRSVFDYKLKRPHNDILAFMCVIILSIYKNNLTFSNSYNLERFLQQFKKIPDDKGQATYKSYITDH